MVLFLLSPPPRLNIMHLDIKPANLFLASDGRQVICF